MTESLPELRESESLMLPTGEVVELTDAPSCAVALDELRLLEEKIREAKRVLTTAIVSESQRAGSKTLHFGEVSVQIRGGRETLWDAQGLEDGLRAAGMTEQRIREVIREEVSYSVVAGEAKRAAAANDEYARIVESSKTVVEKTPSILVERPRSVAR